MPYYIRPFKYNINELKEHLICDCKAIDMSARIAMGDRLFEERNFKFMTDQEEAEDSL